MRSIHFNDQGFNRTYWDFFVGLGLIVTVLYLFAAVFAWQLSRLKAETLAQMRGIAWAFAVCFSAIAILSWRFFFLAPLVLSILITVCLIAAAWRLPKSA